ncbi:MAG TPA: AAA domain-containing protein [Candidatus Saccharimonadales bacterium]
MPASLKQLTMYARDYIDLIAPSLASRQSKKVVLPKDILDVTPLYKHTNDFDYETLRFDLNLQMEVARLEEEEALLDNTDQDEDKAEIDEETRKKLDFSKALDDIYRKQETSSYTKQINLKFGRISFRGKPAPDSFGNDEEDDEEYKSVEQHLFTVPISISFRDSGGKRHYSITIDDSLIKTDISFLRRYMAQEYRDQLFKFVAMHESGDEATIPLKFAYIDELWAKTKQYLLYSDALDIIDEPDLENVIIVLAPKVNHFLSQDLLGIVEAADDDALLETSLSAWVNDGDMSINEPQDDNGSNELFFPFPYDQSQLQVLGKINNKGAVVEGPPGTGKSQTIANILSHLAATNKKVLFVSQKDQAVRGVKDKLKTLDVPYLFGYIPDRSSKLHSDEDDRDSASHALKGLANSGYFSNSAVINPIDNLVNMSAHKPQFDLAINEERKYFGLYEEWLSLDQYDFGEDSERITKDWFDEHTSKNALLISQLGSLTSQESAIESLEKDIAETAQQQDNLKTLHAKLTAAYENKSHYSWVSSENILLRSLTYSQIAEITNRVLVTFDEEATDRKTNFVSSKLNAMKLGRKLDQALSALPQEIYADIKAIVFEETTKTNRYAMLKEVVTYFENRAKLEDRAKQLTNNVKTLKSELKQKQEQYLAIKQDAGRLKNQVSKLQIDDSHMERLKKLLTDEGDVCFERILRRKHLTDELANFEALNPNAIREEIKSEKKRYKTNVRAYIRNRLMDNAYRYRQTVRYRAALESIGRKLNKSKKAYKTFDSLKSDPFNFEAMSGLIPIWMMGLDDASRILPLQANIFDYVIIDEASQCNIAYALPVMFRAKHTILFGDTLQMRDTTIAFKSNEQLSALATKHSIPEDLQIKASEDTVKSVMDIAKLAGFETSILQNHYRSPIELIGFSNDNFYAPRGRALQVVNDDILATDEGRVLTNHVIQPDLSRELSDKTNLSEAYYIFNLVKKIKNDPKTADKSIAILTFFNEQAELIRRVITDEDIKVSAIEGIQGDERDIVIYSFVIKSPEEKRRYTALTGEGGEIKKEINEGRVNVAFSRARLQVHCVTSMPPNIWPDGIWIKKYLDYVEKHGRVARLTKAEQTFDSLFEEKVYEHLYSTLDLNRFSLLTQVESCGFKIDQVIRDNTTGQKLALEIDGPSHFEDGNGQVRVSGDYERQFVLETAGWEFYRISYIDWQQNRKGTLDELDNFIDGHFSRDVAQDDDGFVDEEEYKPSYTTTTVEVPEDLIETIKAASAKAPKNAFGRSKVAKNESIENTSMNPSFVTPFDKELQEKEENLTRNEAVPAPTVEPNDFASWINTQSISVRQPNPETNKGWEARFRVKDNLEADQLTRTLLQAGIAAGKAWSKGASLVVPVYGEQNVTFIQSLTQTPSGYNEVKQEVAAHSTPTIAKPQNEVPATSFSVGEREVDQTEFTKYLNERVNSNIQIRYQSMRAGSARFWRDLELIGFDEVYVQVKHDDKDYPVKYRRDRVVEYK